MDDREPVIAIRVWDGFVRTFHWSLATCVLADYFVVDDGETLHLWLGYIAAALVLARIVWGFVGTRHARFADFFPTPARLWRHLGHMRAGRHDFHAGHNPLGALMMLTLLALVLALAVTGYMQGLDAYWGEEWLQDLHAGLADLTIGLVAVHVLGALVMSRVDRVNLVKAMITGVKVRGRPD